MWLERSKYWDEVSKYQGGVQDRVKQGLEAPRETSVTAGQPLAPGLVSFPLPIPPPSPARTINFKSIVGFEIAGSHFAHHGKHVQKVVQGHVPIPVLREHLGNPLAERVVLGTGSREATPDPELRAPYGIALSTHLPETSKYSPP